MLLPVGGVALCSILDLNKIASPAVGLYLLIPSSVLNTVSPSESSTK